MRLNVVLRFTVIKFLSLTWCKSHNQQDISNSILDVDINTGLIQFNRIASTIQKMPSGGMVSQNRRLSTVKVAMRAILDGIEGDFMETVRKMLIIISIIYSAYNVMIRIFTFLFLT